MRRHLEFATRFACPSPPVLHVPGKRSLPGVHIDRGHASADIHQRNGDMHGHRRFTGSALLIAKHDDMGGRGPTRVRLNRLDATSSGYFSYRSNLAKQSNRSRSINIY